jgi:TolB protein
MHPHSGGRGEGRNLQEFNPDGTEIVFVNLNRQKPPGLVIMNSDGSNQKVLTSMTAADPAWSPDGRTIVFSHQLSPVFPTKCLFTIRSEGTNLKQITEAAEPDGFELQDGRPTFSPDGKVVVFTRAFRGAYRVNADGSELTNLVRAPSATPYLLPAFDETGSFVFYGSSGKIFRVGIDGGAPLILGEGGFD